jgi:hypothetical protein
MKMTKIISASILILLLIVTGCKKDNPVENITQLLPDGISGFVSLKYQYLATAPFHIQTTMLTGYQGRLYRIGGMWDTQVLDLSNNSWSPIQLSDSTVWRWDGAAVTIGDSIYIVAVYNNHYYNILVFDPSKKTYGHTSANLPNYFSHPAYCTYNDKIIFLTAQYDSVFEYNTANRKLRIVAKNPFQGTLEYYNRMASGKYYNYFYVFGGYDYLPTNRFYRLNLDNYVWEDVGVPSVLKQSYRFGASFGNQFIFLGDSVTTYLYSFVERKWYLDTARVPIFPQYAGEWDRGEWSFFAEDSCLYGTDIHGNMVWKISKE